MQEEIYRSLFFREQAVNFMILQDNEKLWYEVRSLKCCGNCDHWQYAWHSNGLDKRCRIKILKQPDRESKCDHWQKL